VLLSTSVAAQPNDLQAVARNLVQAGMVKTGDKVLITGSVRDETLMEHIAIETMKAGGQPLISLSSDSLTRRSFEEVPASYDTLPPSLNLALVNMFDVQISLDVGEADDLLAGVPQARQAARAKANEPVNQAFFQRNASTR
jgi:leucyl aminopeptidase (aminopeptidase T)